jgi:hypothetical protein
VIRGIRPSWTWLEARPARVLPFAVALVVILRLPFLGWPLNADEGGFLYLAQHWDGDGPSLYDHQWVDRPPLLLLVFKLGALLGGALALRLIALTLACMVVVAGWWAGRIINGSTGAVLGALFAAATSSNFIFDGFDLVGEGIAGAFVMMSCALTLQSVWGRSRGGRGMSTRAAFGTVVAAGVLASAAFLTKQNFLDAAVFALVLLVPAVRSSWPTLVAWIAGAAAPLLVTVVWADGRHGPGVTAFWNALFEFRAAAASAIASHPLAAQVHRMHWLVVLFLVSGMGVLSWYLLTTVVRDRAQRRLGIALAATLVYGFVSIALGGNWWRHYLLELVPVLTMAAALASRGRGRWLSRAAAVRIATSLAVASALIATFASASEGARWAQVDRDLAISRWLIRASHPDDSVVLTFGSADIIESSGLTSPYPYSWSLPARIEDPHLRTLVRVLNGPSAPTWLIHISSTHGYYLGNRNPAFATTLAAHYRLFATVCRRDVFLHDGLTRVRPARATGC